MPDRPTILDRLRAETSADHAVLEARLDLLASPLDLDHLRRVLRAFHGFHAAWEPMVEALLGERFRPRRRLGLLAADLRLLGDRDGLPPRPDLAPLPDQASAWGSLYVLEGSTLGGAVIAKALARSGVAGLGYFNPHGRKTMGNWQAFRSELTAAVTPGDEPAALAAARATFARLIQWLPARQPG
ncbi:biliverdin-producing heme oxygenase [Geminicoccus harenae]|uniref:biliverdin-producing heme oxygenase n=1 Tax=Geminicoccus harenae TaxID=2498453 RepID=UPI001C950EC2|nr:biliverdin-producing heme oxygenase [Geminicoccus harenae]